VQGTLSDHLTPFDALRSCFPAGTVSGAPKIRAMEIIEELEPERRGLYAGAVGYAGFDRTLEFAITIRTIIARGRKAEVQVGAGIVADSDPAKEWEETGNKGMALIRAIELVEGSG
jgi:anthranilate synthase component 1